MVPKQNLVQVQLHYASSEFARFISLVISYKWFIIAGIVVFLVLIYWLWRR